MHLKTRLIGVISCTALLAGCGGGSGSSSSSSGAITTGQQPATETAASSGATLSFSGVTAVGAPLVNAKVTVKCVTGAESVTTDQMGSFSVQVKNAALPCVAQVVSGNVTLHSATDREGTFNVTTLTDLMMASIAKTDPSTFYESFGSNTASTITATSLKDAQSRVRFVLPYMILSDKTDFVTTKFVADGKDGMDAALDVIAKGLDESGKTASKRDLASIETLRYGGTSQEELGAPDLMSLSSVTVDPKEPRKFYFTASLSTPVYSNGGSVNDTKPVVIIADYAKKTLQQFATSNSGLGLSSGITLDPNAPDRFLNIGVLFGTQPQMALRESKDYGLTWQQISGPSAFQSITPPIELNVKYLRFSADGATMFAYSTEEGNGMSLGMASYVAMSVNGGATWQRPQGFTDTQVGPIYVSPSNPNIIYAVNNGRFLRSNDKGLTFTALPNIPNSQSFSLTSKPVSVDPFDADVLYSVSGDLTFTSSANGNPLKIYKSADGGQSWKEVNMAGCCDTYLPAVFSIANRSLGSMQKVYFSSTVKGLIYFPFRADAYNLQMLRSRDGGATWKLLSFTKPVSTTSSMSTPIVSQPFYTPAQIYSTAPRDDGGVDIYVRSLTGKGIDRFVDYLGAR